MGHFFAYSFVCSLALLFGWVGYMMSRGGSPRLRRRVIVAVYVFSLIVVPFIVSLDFGPTSEAVLIPADFVVDSELKEMAERGTDSVMGILLLVYLLGVFMIAFLTLIGIMRVVRIMKGSERRKIGGFTFLVHNRRDIDPFCFGKYIVIGSADVDREEIVIHEKAHASLSHFADLFVAQFAAIVCWYCPAVWLLSRELKLLHEYEADAAVVDGGVDMRAYCQMLVWRAAGVRMLPAPGNHFAKNSLKKRIFMLQTPKAAFGTGLWVVVAVLVATVCSAFLLSGSSLGSAVGRMSQTSLSAHNDLTSEGAFVVYGVDLKRHQVSGREGVVLPRTGAIVCRDRRVLDRVASGDYKISVDGKVASRDAYSSLPASKLWKVVISARSIYVFTTDSHEASLFNSVESAMESESKRRN